VSEEFGARQKAAALVIALGTEKARGLLGHLNEDEVRVLAAEIAKLEDVGAEQRDGVYRETLENASRAGIHGGMDRAKELLATYDGGSGDMMLDDLPSGRFKFLTSMGEAAGQILQDEHPQVIAVVLSESSPEESSTIMDALPEDLRSEISFRLATIDEIEPDSLAAIKECLKLRVSAPQPSKSGSTVDGAKSMAEILNAGTKENQEEILGFMEQQDKEVADRVRALMFVFEDIVEIDDRGIQGILKNLDTKTLSLALKGTTEQVQSRITSNLSERAKASLLEEIDLMGPVRRSEVEEAQAECVAQIRLLEESGELVLARGGTDELIT